MSHDRLPSGSTAATAAVTIMLVSCLVAMAGAETARSVLPQQNSSDAPSAPNATLAPNATFSPANATLNQTKRNRTRTASLSQSVSGTATATQSTSTSASPTLSSSTSIRVAKKKRTRTATDSKTIRYVPPTPAPSLNGDDLLRSYDYYAALVLDVPSLTFTPDDFAQTYLAPALADRTFVGRTVLLDWCGINLNPLPTAWAPTWCGSDVTTQYPNTVVRYTFARAVGPSNYTSPNVNIAAIPSLHGAADIASALYLVVENPPPVFTDAPGLFEKAAGSAMSPGGIVIIIFILLMLVAVVVYIVRKVFLKPTDRALRGAAYSVGPDPPQPGRAEFEMARTSNGADAPPPTYDQPSKQPGGYGQGPPAYSYGNSGAASGYGRASSTHEPSPSPSDPAPANSHAVREMDVAY